MQLSVGACLFPFKEKIDKSCSHILVIHAGHDEQRGCLSRYLDWHEGRTEVGAEEIGTLAGFGGNLFCIEQDEPAEGLLANGAEVGMLVGAHATVFLRTPDAFAEVAAALDE